MGTVRQLLALPACFLLVGLLGGGCRPLLLSLLRRVGRLMGAEGAPPSGRGGWFPSRAGLLWARRARTRRCVPSRIRGLQKR